MTETNISFNFFTFPKYMTVSSCALFGLSFSLLIIYGEFIHILRRPKSVCSLANTHLSVRVSLRFGQMNKFEFNFNCYRIGLTYK